jgi:hypothetical protein
VAHSLHEFEFGTIVDCPIQSRGESEVSRAGHVGRFSLGSREITLRRTSS